MDIKQISRTQLNEIIAKTEFDYDLLVKDYYITLLLYILKDIKGIYFKGGTALQLTLLDHVRISEDIDFTLTRPIKNVRKEIEIKIKDSDIFDKITSDKNVEKFVRLIASYKTEFGDDKVLIDLNEREKLLTKPEFLSMNHFYPNIPKFSVNCLSRNEMIAEKIAAAIGRNKPRDHYDVYQIIKKGFPIDRKLVEKKCILSGNDPSIINMFKRAKKLYNRWNEDMVPLLVEEVTFQEVMSTIAKHFNLKYEKDKLKD